ncbi:ABC transporter ATP-binding protein [Fimbriiglobus ruber]|uniref:Putrescine transport ATP-binding protein PotA n=1 Tax=Fimbriiglobus ruber TaxID=1908690 RepID=A0A225E8J6_9BACT|nr:ABC transporter ATP-binding protein [Fimbriiglobus ruber]OWK46406.1 Putrescine transport ATP-binding protein PotA [Fimbriiglobus ruber]
MLTPLPTNANPHHANGSPDAVRVVGVRFGYGAVPAVRDVSLSVPAGQLLTLLGPSGCGKTTLLKLIGGYQTPASGRIELCGRDVTTLPPEARNAGMVFQNYALFPHLTARQNVAFGLEVRRVSKADCTRRVDAVLEKVGLSAGERDRKPAALSGGQQQRVALARALVFEPDVLLLDEPLANLDRHLRDQLRDELRSVQRDTGVTTIVVTHDQEEALAVSDLVAVMSEGRGLQVGTPAEVYDRPSTPFVARFLGAANLVAGDTLGLPPGSVAMIRPEQIVLGPAAHSCTRSWSAVVSRVTFLGADLIVEVACEAGPMLRARGRAADQIRSGQHIQVGVPGERVWLIPETDLVDDERPGREVIDGCSPARRGHEQIAGGGECGGPRGGGRDFFRSDGRGHDRRAT